ncbi:hypothetical protein [Streptomyces sp. NPDC048669]|uniref:hypothetical protein n=1 Tax=Streptomyces sp. NPDC048669 TaxID=3155267 RepID=UPI00342F26DA
MSFRTAHRRTAHRRTAHRRIALRSAIATAALAGGVLLPAAGAFADTTPSSPAPSSPAPATSVPVTPAPTTSAPASPAPSSPAPTTSAPASPAPTTSVPEGDEYTDDGTLVHKDVLKGGLTARVYKHGDAHVYYTAVILEHSGPLGALTAGPGYVSRDTRTYRGISVTLYADGRITSVNGGGGEGPVYSGKCTVSVTTSVGGGTGAVLTISPSGPSVFFKDAGYGTILDVGPLDRLHLKLPASAGFVGEIINPNSTAPRLKFNMQGGGNPAGYTDFPKLPKGCSFLYGTGSGTGDGKDTHSSQTSVVPKGSVAAGAELEQGGGHPALIAAGGAAAAVGAAGVGFVALRRRTAAAGR